MEKLRPIALSASERACEQICVRQGAASAGTEPDRDR